MTLESNTIRNGWRLNMIERNGVVNAITHYINAIVMVNFHEGRRYYEELNKRVVANIPCYEYDPNDDTFEFEYTAESYPCFNVLEAGKLYAIYLEVKILTTRDDYYMEYDTDYDIKEFTYKELPIEYLEDFEEKKEEEDYED